MWNLRPSTCKLLLLGCAAALLAAAPQPEQMPAQAGGDPAREAQRLLERWLAAQNQGDFAAYEALYAERFTGIRRSGDRTVRLMRAGWMKDRRRMFEKKMTVSAADLKVSATPSSAQMLFSQTFESGTYRDVGPKQMVLYREKDGFRIAREEMISSTLLSKVALDDKTQKAAAHLYLASGRVVLHSAPKEEWGKGAPQLLSDEDPVVVLRDVREERLPDELTRWRGQKVRLLDDRGERCEATVRGLKMMGRVHPHFGTREEWRRVDRKRMAQEAWDLAASGILLVGELSGVTEACEKATWARPAGLPVPKVAPAQSENGPIEVAALEAFRKLPAYRAIQKEYAAWHKQSGKKGKPLAYWENIDNQRATMKVMRWQEGGRSLTLVAVMAGETLRCSEFDPRLHAVWTVEDEKKGPKLRLLVSGSEPDGFSPRAAVDVDGDGEPEVLLEVNFGEGLLRKSGIETLSVPFLDCPC